MKTKNTKLDPIPRELVIMSWIMVLGIMAPMLDSTMVNIAVNQLSIDFYASLALVQWTVTGFILAMGAAVPFSSWLVMRFSGKTVYLWAEIAFGVASLLSGISWNIESLIIFRLIQGFAGGLLMPVMFTLLVDSVGGNRMGRMMAIIGLPMTLGPMVGPIIGGLLVQYLSWRWIFFVNVPVVIVAAILLTLKVPQVAPKNKTMPFDYVGVALLIAISTTIVYGVVQASTKGTFNNATTLAYVGVGMMLAFIYIGYARMNKEKAVMPLHLFKHRNFSGSMLGIFLSGFVTSGPMLLLPLFFQDIRGESTIIAAVSLIPQSIGMLVSRTAIGNLIDSLGARWVTIIGVAVTLVGTIPFMYFDASSPYVLIALVMFIRGIGGSAIKSATQADAYIGLDKSDSAAASLSSNLFQQIGSGFATAVLATAVTAYNTNHHVSNIAQLAHTYQYGFMWSTALVIVILIPAMMLSHKVKI
ncbi:DHA2 family efflux MFS transporter permease subunit [Dellaglioa sp. BT-FLS60]